MKEIAGEFGSGKSQICYALYVTANMPPLKIRSPKRMHQKLAPKSWPKRPTVPLRRKRMIFYTRILKTRSKNPLNNR
jgi:hypothetical protein